ncbi:hypothetical protein D7X33_11280 [Butyricicoccus sp. 1XD8-22]|nr:hypothetical protein D7X33_11280 [Butyricicoccus sp. 1XD8-22]
MKNRVKSQFDFTPYQAQSDSQLLETGKQWVDENNYYSLQKCFDFIGALRQKEKFNVAVQLSQYLFDKVPSARNLNALMISINNEGDIDKQVSMLRQIEELLKKCNISYERNVFGTWLKTTNNLIDIGKVDRQLFFDIYDKCPEEEKTTNSYIIAQYYVRLNADGRYDEVVSHYRSVAPGTQNNFYVKKYYARAVELSGKKINDFSIVTTDGSADRSVDSKGVFIVYGRDNDLYNFVLTFLKMTDAKAISLAETGPEGSKTIIEQLENHIREAKYAIVLLSPDDIGYLATGNVDEKEKRARQNVLIEYGYTLGFLGRQNVISISVDSSLDLPTDLHGIRFIPLNLKDKKPGILDLIKQMEKWNFNINKDLINLLF